MLNRVAALAYCGRSYKNNNEDGIETRMNFSEAAAFYHGQLLSPELSSAEAEKAAEFLFFSGRTAIVSESENRLLAPAVASADIYAYCAYSRAANDIPGALSLLLQAREQYPDDPKLPNDIFRLNLVLNPGSEPTVLGADETLLESFQGIASNIYLIFFLHRRGLITELPKELADIADELRTIASGEEEYIEALLAAGEFASLTSDHIKQEQLILEALQRNPRHFDTLSEAARCYRTREEHRITGFSPLKCAETMCSIRPWHPEGYYLTALITNTGSDVPNAGTIPLFEKALSIDNSDLDILEDYLQSCALIASRAESGNRKTEYKQIMHKAIDSFPAAAHKDPAFLARAGITAFEGGLKQEGEQLVVTALEAAPESSAVLSAAGSMAYLQSVNTKDEQKRSRFLENAIGFCSQAWKNEPDPLQKGEYLLALARIFQESGDTDRELAALIEGADMSIPEPDIYFRISEIFHQSSQPEEAAKALQKGFSLLPDSIDLGVETARALSRSEEFTQALEIINNLILRYPNAPWIWNQLGIIQVEWGNSLPEKMDKKAVKQPEERIAIFSKACDAFSQACILEPAEAIYRSNYGDALRLAGELEKAVGVLKESLKLKPDEPFTLNALGQVFSEKAKKETAREKQEELISEADYHLRRAAENDPGNPVYRVNLADLFYELGYFEETIELYQQIIETAADAWQYYDIVGLCNYHVGHYDEAEKWFSMALEREPEAPEVINSLGLCMLGHGNVNKAIEYFKQASLLDPVNPVYLDNIAMAQYNLDGYTTDMGDSPRM